MNDSFSRKFEWNVTSNKKIIIFLEFSKKDVKNEIENFGINLKMKNPAYLAKRGFILTRTGLKINYKFVFDMSSFPFKKISNDIISLTGMLRGEDPVSAMLKLVQSIKYKIPPKYYKGKYIMEFFPPLTCMYENYGDCDTKSVLLANIIRGASYKKERMAVIILKGFGIFHAILAIERPPLPGMLSFYIDRIGPFIPLETTDRGWMPGFTNRQVVQCLQKGQFRFVKLF